MSFQKTFKQLKTKELILIAIINPPKKIETSYFDTFLIFHVMNFDKISPKLRVGWGTTVGGVYLLRARPQTQGHKVLGNLDTWPTLVVVFLVSFYWLQLLVTTCWVPWFHALYSSLDLNKTLYMCWYIYINKTYQKLMWHMFWLCGHQYNNYHAWHQSVRRKPQMAGTPKWWCQKNWSLWYPIFETIEI